MYVLARGKNFAVPLSINSQTLIYRNDGGLHSAVAILAKINGNTAEFGQVH